jgi:hypothetical protein
MPRPSLHYSLTFDSSKIIKRNGANTIELLQYAYIPELVFN